MLETTCLYAKKKKSSGLFENVIYQMCLIYMYKEDLALNKPTMVDMS